MNWLNQFGLTGDGQTYSNYTTYSDSPDNFSNWMEYIWGKYLWKKVKLWFMKYIRFKIIFLIEARIWNPKAKNSNDASHKILTYGLFFPLNASNFLHPWTFLMVLSSPLLLSIADSGRWVKRRKVSALFMNVSCKSFPFFFCSGLLLNLLGSWWLS